MVLKRLLILLSVISLAAAHHSEFQYDGEVENEKLIKFQLVLPIHNQDVLLKELDIVSDPTSSSYGNYLTNDQVMNIVRSPYDNYVFDTMSFLGFDNCENFGDAVQCIDSVSKIDRIFNTRMSYYLYNNDVYIRSSTNYVMPSILKNYVTFVNGLSNKLFPVHTSLHKDSSSVSPDPGYFGREVALSMYNMGSATVVNPTTSLAAVEFNGGGFSQKSLNESQIYNGVPTTTVYKSVGSNPGGGTETELDMNMMVDIASNVELWYMNYNGWIYDMALDVFNRDERPDVLSLSYGWAEWDQCVLITCTNNTAAEYIDRTNMELAKLGALGVTVVVASGDAGSPGRTNEGCESSTRPINPVFPGSSPYVVSVGATFVVSNGKNTTDWNTQLCKDYGCTTGTENKVINYNYTGWTSGSGFGIYKTEPVQKWQKDFVAEYLSSGVKLPSTKTWNSGGRGYPDLTANGHNCAVYMGGSFMDVDGTSCSTPVVASMLALLNDHQTTNKRPKLGLVNPLLYKMKTDNAAMFKHPLGGNSHCTEETCCSEDFGFQTPPKETNWNPLSGLGQPNLKEMVKYLDSMFI
jgi:tripeptidyl-peptidase I